MRSRNKAKPEKHILKNNTRRLTVGVKNELKSREQIQKERKEKEKNKIKQMSKKERAAYLHKHGKRGNFKGKRRSFVCSKN